MASLTTCIKKAGAFLPAEDRAAILSAAQEARAGGMKAGEAGRAAVEERAEQAGEVVGGGGKREPGDGAGERRVGSR